MTDTDRDTAGLETLFAAARRETAVLPEALEARILADAARQQRVWAATGARVAPGPIRQLLALLGGWPTVGGLTAACAAGVWLGFAPPAALPDPVGAVVQSQFQALSDLDAYGAEDLIVALSEEI